VKGDRTEYEKQPDSRKKKAMKTLLESLSKTNSGLLTRSEKQGTGQAHKYIVIIFDGREQVISFPHHVQHSEVFHYTKRECPHVALVSAGFFIADGDALWSGGRSESLELDSRPQDADLLKSFLTSPDRNLWDLTLLGGAQ
jgi:hypothetical protein